MVSTELKQMLIDELVTRQLLQLIPAVRCLEKCEKPNVEEVDIWDRDKGEPGKV